MEKKIICDAINGYVIGTDRAEIGTHFSGIGSNLKISRSHIAENGPNLRKNGAPLAGIGPNGAQKEPSGGSNGASPEKIATKNFTNYLNFNI